MQMLFVDLRVDTEVEVLPAHNGRKDVLGETSGSAAFITSDLLRGEHGSVLVEWPDGEQAWIPIRRVPRAADARIPPIVVHDESEAA